MQQPDIMFQLQLQRAKLLAFLELISRVVARRTASMQVLGFSQLGTLRLLRLLALLAPINQILAKLAA